MAGTGVAFVAHCLLNQNSKVGDGAHCAGIYSPVFWAVREQLDTPAFRAHCRRLAGTVADMISVRAARGEQVALIGVEGSPSMGVLVTSSDPARGGRPEWPDGSQELAGGEGIFIEELRRELAERGIGARLAGETQSLPGHSPAGQRSRLEEVLAQP